MVSAVLPAIDLVLELLAQAGAVRLDPNLLTMILGIVAFAGTALLGIVAFLIKRLITSFDGFKKSIRTQLTSMHSEHEKLARETQAIKQELIGIDGRNGIKGEQRSMRRSMNRQSQILNRLAKGAGVALDEEIEQDEDTR